MMESKRNVNQVSLRGVAAGEPRFSHENHGEPFYKFPLTVARLSGQDDVLTILASRAVLESCPVREGTRLAVFGQLRSFNNRSPEGSRLLISVFAQLLTETEEEPFNQIFLTGTICKPPVLRRTPLGRSICDLMLACNRRYGRADYLPCIAWGQVALSVGELSVGGRIALEGRVQSRTYNKVLEERIEQRVAYEVSIMQLLQEEDQEESLQEAP